MPYSVRKIPGVGPAVAKRLARADIRTTEALLLSCHDRRERRFLSAQTGLAEKHLQRFVSLADLMRIRGIGGDYAELLIASGVRSVRELSRRRPLNLALKMNGMNTAKRISRRVPSASMVERWIGQASQMKSGRKRPNARS